MTSGLQCSDLIERYLSTCDIRFLRDERGGAYFSVPNAHYGRLHVHLEISASFGDMLTVQVTPARSFPAADRPWLTRFADAWNEQNRSVTALLGLAPSLSASASRCADPSGSVRTSPSTTLLRSSATPLRRDGPLRRVGAGWRIGSTRESLLQDAGWNAAPSGGRGESVTDFPEDTREARVRRRIRLKCPSGVGHPFIV